MVKVENKDTLRLLTRKFMKMNRGRNIIAIIAIMLTSLLFTTLFMGSVSLVLSRRAAEIKQFMDSSHAIIQNLTEEEGKRVETTLQKNKQIERYGTGIFLGAGLNEQFGFSTEVRYADANLAESFNCTPTTGKLPQNADEIAVSTVVLDTLGMPARIGESITLTWEKGSNGSDAINSQTDTFRLCGFWEGDKAVLSQMIWVSKDYANQNLYHPTKKEIQNGIYQGSRDYCVWYKNLWNLEKKTDELSNAAGFIEKGTGFEVNPAYNLMEEDAFSFTSVGVMLLFILLAGYLIIYNIFSISVKSDIRTYGLLKNVGTTGKQLKKIVRMQAWRLSLVGIPIGLALGYAAGLCMAPSLNADTVVSAQEVNTSEAVVSANPLIFLAAAVFTLLTVYLSSLQACKIVEKVTPVEALHLAESDQTRKKMKKNTSVSWWGMAVQNMLRNWKRGFIVMTSIALSLVVINCIVMLVQGYDFDAYKKVFLASDFQLDQMTGTLRTTNFNGISAETRGLLDACPEKKTSGYIYYSDETHQMEPEVLKVWESYAKKYESNWGDYEKSSWDELKKTGNIRLHFLGISHSVFDKLEWKGEPASWEQFQSGNYVIVDYNDKYAEKPVSYYQMGDAFSMQYSNGKQKNYEVLGEALMPYALDYPYADMLYITVIVPEEEYISQTENDAAMYAELDAKKGQEKQVQKYIEETVLKENEQINVFSILDMKAGFQRFINKYYMIGGFLVLVLAFIGIMNFYNTTATSVLSRKKELALLEVVGMTKRQILKMLIAEGCIYLAGALLIAVAIIVFGAQKILVNTIGQAFFFRMHLTILPCVILIPALMIVAVMIPKLEFRKMKKESVVERIAHE